MTALEWTAQAALLALLLAAIPFALRLERGLAALRRDRAALAASAEGFEAAAREAQATLADLRAALEAAARQSALGESLRDDLRFLAERAETLADRLDRGIRQGARGNQGTQASRPPTPAPDGPLPAGPLPAGQIPASQAERDLLHALRMAR